MLKYYKQIFGNYEFADVLQTLSLILFVAFFTTLTWYIYSRPKNYYKKVSELPLEDDTTETPQNLNQEL